MTASARVQDQRQQSKRIKPPLHDCTTNTIRVIKVTRFKKFKKLSERKITKLNAVFVLGT